MAALEPERGVRLGCLSCHVEVRVPLDDLFRGRALSFLTRHGACLTQLDLASVRTLVAACHPDSLTA